MQCSASFAKYQNKLHNIETVYLIRQAGNLSYEKGEEGSDSQESSNVKDEKE